MECLVLIEIFEYIRIFEYIWIFEYIRICFTQYKYIYIRIRMKISWTNIFVFVFGPEKNIRSSLEQKLWLSFASILFLLFLQVGGWMLKLKLMLTQTLTELELELGLSLAKVVWCLTTNHIRTGLTVFPHFSRLALINY